MPPTAPPFRADAAVHWLRAGVPGWVPRGALVAEQPDPTFPLAAGLAAGLVALALAGWEVTRRRATARLAAGAPAVDVLAVWRGGDEVDLWDADGSAPFARVWVRWDPGLRDATGADGDHADEDRAGDGWTEEYVARFGAAWRDPSSRSTPFDPDGPEPARPEPTTAVGDLRQGGWVALTGPAGTLWPRVGVRLLHDADDEDDEDEEDLFRGDPVVPGTGWAPDVPLVLRRPPADRLLGAMLLAGFALGPVAAALLAEGWHQRLLALWLGGSAGLSGLARRLAGMRLEHAALVVTTPFRTYGVPWGRLHGVRRDGDRLRLAWVPDEVVEVGPFAPVEGESPDRTAGLAADLAMRLRARALATGHDGGPVTRSWTRTVPAATLYLVLALALLAVLG